MRVVEITFNEEGEMSETSVEVKSLSDAFLELGADENEEKRKAVIEGKKPYVIKKRDGVYRFILYSEDRYNACVERVKKKWLETPMNKNITKVIRGEK